MPNAHCVRVEPARSADIPALIALLAALFEVEKDFCADPARQRRGIELLLTQGSERAMVLVARSQAGEVVGMASGQLVISTAEGAPSAWIEDVVVQSAWRHRGIGRLLIEALLAWAQRQGATRAQLLADTGNTSALAFYRRNKWRPMQ
ncbi:MAG: GNAT family N-acetyltransferase, partial [Betaproteobacteria bacterium]